MQQVKRGESAVYHKEEEVSPGKERESVESVVGLDCYEKFPISKCFFWITW